MRSFFFNGRPPTIDLAKIRIYAGIATFLKANAVLLLLAISLLIALPSMGQEKKMVASKLNDVTVFFKGAELIHSASSALLQGDNELWIEGLSPEIDKNSLKIKSSNGVVVSAYEYSVDFLSEGKIVQNPLVKKFQDSMDVSRKKLDLIDTDIKVNNELIGILKKSTDKNIAGSEKGLPIDELMKTMEYYQTKLTALENVQRELEKQKVALNTTMTRLTNQISQESVKNNKTSGILKLTLSSPLAAIANFTISYYTPSAAWMPYYDIHVESIDKPIKFASKARVRQTTGLDWNRVKLALSSATPNNGKVAPLFNTWFLNNQYAPAGRGYLDGAMMQNSVSYGRSSNRKMKNDVDYDLIDRLNREINDTRNRPAAIEVNISDEEPSYIYIVDGTHVDLEYFQALDRAMVKSETFVDGNSAKAKYGASASAGAYVIEMKSSMDDYVTQTDKEMEIAFNIDIPYTIPGNGKEQSIGLPTKQAEGEFKYYCAPKLDKQTFLLAEISDWQKLGLLSGKASVTYDGTYVGETFIDANSTQKKLPLTLGADRRVVVKRETMQDFSSTKFLGSDVKQVFTYKLTVRNNQNKTVKMVLKDQYPKSKNKNIEVEFLAKDTTPWTFNNEDVGVVTWESDFAPGESKEYIISYSVKYPKDSNLNF